MAEKKNSCPHESFRSNGRSKGGKQRYRCNLCNITWSVGDTDARHISTAKELKIQRLLLAGRSIREVAKEAGVCKKTVMRRAGTPAPPPQVKRGIGPRDCDWCGKRIETKREFGRRTRRVKHKFCNSICYQAFYKEKRSSNGRIQEETTAASRT